LLDETLVIAKDIIEKQAYYTLSLGVERFLFSVEKANRYFTDNATSAVVMQRWKSRTTPRLAAITAKSTLTAMAQTARGAELVPRCG
jgi:hypothetical protein